MAVLGFLLLIVGLTMTYTRRSPLWGFVAILGAAMLQAM